MDLSATRIQTDIEFDRDGRQVGDFKLRPSDNSRSLGYHPVPVACLKNGDGPTLLVCGGTHGDEFEGTVAIMRLIHDLDVTRLRGRLILVPALNGPAMQAFARCSPLDGGNLNRCFPGDRNGTTTQQIAHLIESVVLPECDAAIDIHSGGKASEFVPLTMYAPGNSALGQRNHELARVFGAPWCWVMSEVNDDRSLNSAALRQQVPMIATELGGGGRVNREYAQLAGDGINRVMQHLGMWVGSDTGHRPAIQYMNIPASTYTVFAVTDGLFVPAHGLATRVEENESLGEILHVFEPERQPTVVLAPESGLIMSQTEYGIVSRGDYLVQLAQTIDAPE